MEPASMSRRIMAFWIDSFIGGLCFLPVWIQGFASYLQDGAISFELRWLLAGLLLKLFYNWMFLYFLSGTIGKLMLGLRVVPRARRDHNNRDVDGLGLMQSFLRVLTDALSFFFGQALRALAFVRLDRTHVSDWVAETQVVQLSPRRSPPRRHWFIAAVIIFFSFLSQFQQVYELIQRSSYSEGTVVIDTDP